MLGATVQLHEVNGQPGAVVHDRDGRVINVFSLDIADGVVQTIRSVINPDKLRHLGPLADVRGLLSELRGQSRDTGSAGTSPRFVTRGRRAHPKRDRNPLSRLRPERHRDGVPS